MPKGNPNWIPGGGGGNPAGRPKGTKNKVPTSLVNEVLFVYDKLKTEKKGLLDEARLDPPWFYEHFIKVLLPKNVNLDFMGIMEIELTIGGKKLDA